MSHFLYFYRRFIWMLSDVIQNPRKLTAFCILLAIAFVVSLIGYRDKEDNEPKGGKILANVLWLSLGLGAFVAFGCWVANVMARMVGMKKLGLKFREILKFALLPYRYHIRKSHSAKGDGTMLFWTLLAGMWIAAAESALGGFFMLSLVGFPFALTHWKLAKLIASPQRYHVLADFELG